MPELMAMPCTDFELDELARYVKKNIQLVFNQRNNVQLIQVIKERQQVLKEKLQYSYLELIKQNPEVHALLGKLYGINHEHEKAQASLKKAIYCDAEDYHSYIALADLQGTLLSCKNHRAALYCMEKQLQRGESSRHLQHELEVLSTATALKLSHLEGPSR
jgi:tetratricopeptide (TPR) repeat protein